VPETSAVAFNCVAERPVPYSIAAGVFHVTLGGGTKHCGSGVVIVRSVQTAPLFTGPPLVLQV
jgi:hypothetical protein